jgi:hypothetical protein
VEPGHDVSRSDVRNRVIGFDLLWPEFDQGAQERLVPARKGCIPEDPDGGHSTHAGALLEGAAVALPEDPPEAARDEVVPALRRLLDWLPVVPPVEPPLPADPVAEPPVVVLGVA